MSATLTQQQQQQLKQQQQQQKKARANEGLKDMTPRLVPSGKVYRQLFEAQVQLSEAYEKVKEKYLENPPQVRVTEDNIPLVKEGRAVRGNGILTVDQYEWLNTDSNDVYNHNPVYEKYKSDEKKARVAKLKKKADRVEVNELPDTVVPASIGSDIEARIERSRKKKHEIVWEDMLHEIALTNINLEPAVKKASQSVLVQLAEDDLAINDLLEQLNDDESVLNSTSERFETIKSELLMHSEKRQGFIEQMDEAFAKIEKERVESIRSIFNKYSEELFRINYHPRPEIERLLDAEIQLLNNHILINKSCYAQLYAKLLTADIEREKNQMAFVESKVSAWQENRLNVEIKRLEDFIQNLDMLNPRNEPNPKYFEEELQAKQKLINQNRLGLIDALKSLRPPESTKTAIHKWFNSLNDHSRNLDELNINYISGLKSNYEESNQKILNEIQSKMKSLIESKIVNESQTKEIMEHKFLPLWSRKQREIEKLIDQTEAHFEELSQVTTTQFNSLFKFLQGLTHIWDMHELGLVKKERHLQDLLQECRQENDIQNQKREEKLDSILDQMRESSSEKDLKRLLSNVNMQLEAIKRGYESFHDAQIEIVKSYPEMVVDELKKYKNALYKFFSIRHVATSSDSKTTTATRNEAERRNSKDAGENENMSSESDGTADIVRALEDLQDSLKEVLTTNTGNKYYITQQPLTTDPASNETKKDEDGKNLDDSETELSQEAIANDILGYDELIPNTKPEFARKMQYETYLKSTYISPEQLIEAKKLVRLNFLNHLEKWLGDANLRSSAIVSVKSEEIAKELELRVHLHEPRMKRVEMDVHNVRAAELIMHDERVDRHCKGIEEAIKNMEKKFLSMQTYLNELAAQHRSDVLTLEIGFNNANKSIRLLALQDQLNRQRDKHMENVKMTLRNFRSKFDETLAYLRNSNAKFRSSFNIFSDGGNFSADEIDTYKKKLEKMANLIDKNETNMLKDMEKLEKKHLDEAIKLMTQFQEKFKYHLVDLQFIEKISRWLNDTQIKIKTQVSASNSQAKRLSKLIIELDKRLDACERPNLDKMIVKPSDLLEFIAEVNELIYERADLLKCFADTDTIPLHFRAKLPNAGQLLSKIEETEQHVPLQGNPAHSLTPSNKHHQPPQHHHQQQHHLKPEASATTATDSNNLTSTESADALASTTASTHPISTAAASEVKPKGKNEPANNQNLADSSSVLKSSSKVISEDSALVIMRTILNNTRDAGELVDKSSLQKSELSFNPDGKNSKSSKNSKGSKKNSNPKQNKSAPKLSLSNSSFDSSKRMYAVAEVYKIIEERRAKTRDEMYAYYCTFGEQKHPGTDFLANVINILRDALEGILTNSEIFYREVQQQNRQITRPHSLKETYAEFAEAIIHKLKSYHAQCEVYHNQCLKEFRESLTNYEILLERLPELVISEIYKADVAAMENDLKKVRQEHLDKINAIDSERAKNESSLRPNLGHPNIVHKLEELNELEIKRQKENRQLVQEYIDALTSCIRKHAEGYLKNLSQSNERLLLKFDDLLVVDDVIRPEILPEKHTSSELIRRKMAGMSLEDPDPEPLIKREKGRWKGIEKYDILVDNKSQQPTVISTVNTAKTTLPHKKSSEIVQSYHEKFKLLIDENLKMKESQRVELNTKLTRWIDYWANSIKSIKNLYN